MQFDVNISGYIGVSTSFYKKSMSGCAQFTNVTRDIKKTKFVTMKAVSTMHEVVMDAQLPNVHM